jgi:hypothetical protein
VQILYGGKENESEVYRRNERVITESHIWVVYSGPQGLAVNPCDPGPFAFILKTAASIVNGTDFAHPPYPPTMGESIIINDVPWDDSLQYHGENCFIKSAGQEAPPTFECGNTLVIDFEKDARFDDPEMRCEDGFRYRRGWTVEY